MQTGLRPNKRKRETTPQGCNRVPPNGMDQCNECGGWKKINFQRCAYCNQKHKEPCTGGSAKCMRFKNKDFPACAECWQANKQKAHEEKELMKTLSAMFNWCLCGNGVIVEGKGVCQCCLDEFDEQKKKCNHCNRQQLLVPASDMCYECTDKHVETLAKEQRTLFLYKLKVKQDKRVHEITRETTMPLP